MERYEIPERFNFANIDTDTMKTAGMYTGAAVVAVGVIYLGYKIGGYIGGKIGEQVGEMVDEAFAAAANTDNSSK